MASTNKALLPEAKAGLGKFKYEVASAIGIANYQSVDKGNLTSKQNGSVGGQMVKKMIESVENGMK